MASTDMAANVRMKRECIQRVSLAMGKEISEAKATEMLQGVRYHMAKVRETDPAKWAAMSKQEQAEAGAKLYSESLKAEAALIRKRAALTIIAQDQLNRRMEWHRQRGYRGLAVTQAILEDGFRSVNALQNEYVTKFAKTLDGKMPGFLGLFEDKRFAKQFIDEIYGKDSGSQLAKDAVKAFADVSESLRVRFNSAGGNLGKIENYFPQTHDPVRMAHAAEVLQGQGRVRQTVNVAKNWVTGNRNMMEEQKSAWVDYIAPKLDRSKYLDLNGDLMSDADFTAMLGRVYETIITSGEVDFDTSTVAGNSVRGQASRANRGDNHRTLHFQNADTFFEYQQMFGRDSVIETVIGSLRRTAKDVALLEMYGPNPNNMVAGLKRVGEADIVQGKLQMGVWKNPISIHMVNASWNVLNGDAGRIAPGRELFSDFMQGMRNIEVFSKLQSTFITSFTDFPSYFVSAGIHHIPVLTALKNFSTSLGKNNKELMIRSGVIAQTLSSSLVRWGDAHIGKGWTSAVADATMKVTLLDAWTNAVRRASMKNNMATLAGLVKTPWEKLEPFVKNQLERAGVDERIWRIWGEAKPYEQNGAKFLTTQDIREIDWQAIKDGTLRKLVADNSITQKDIDKAASTLVTFLSDESQMASLNPDLFTRGVATAGLQKGSVSGELMRGLMLFKSFPISYMRRHLERVSDLTRTRGKASATLYAATVMVSTTLFGALVIQLRELLAGRDPQDMSSLSFWIQAVEVGGGAGFLTDFMVSGLNGENSYGSPNFLKFFGPLAGSTLDAFDVGKAYWNEGVYDKESKANAKALRFARNHAPFINAWYLKGVIDRAIYNDLMEAASPGYLARIQRRELRNKGTGFWWKQQELLPDRAPNWHVTKPQQ